MAETALESVGLGGYHQEKNVADTAAGELYAPSTKSGNIFCKIEVAGTAVTASRTEDFTEWTSLLSMNVLDITRQTNPNPTQDKKSSGRVIVQNTPLIIPHEKSSIDITQALLDGADCTVYVTRIGHFKGDQRKPIEEYTFTNCEIQRVADQGDNIMVVYRASKVKKKINSYDLDGTGTGSSEFTYDIALNKTE